MTKAQVASENAAGGKTPSPDEQVTTREYPALGNEPEDDESEDAFKEIPTVANRAKPTGGSPEGGDAGAPPAPAEGAGAYRILRPMTSDIIDPPTPTKVDASASKRMVLGPARKPK